MYDDQVPGKGAITTRDYSSRTGLERQFTQDIVDDLVRTKPRVLLVLRPDSTTTLWGGARRFDYLDYFGSHPTFRDSVLLAYAAADPDRRRRFEYEARAASALEHPKICGLYDIGCEIPSHPSTPSDSAAPYL